MPVFSFAEPCAALRLADEGQARVPTLGEAFLDHDQPRSSLIYHFVTAPLQIFARRVASRESRALMVIPRAFL